MPESRYRLFWWVVQKAISAEEFQFLCLLYLRERGFDCVIGPMPGRDEGNDIYGRQPAGESMVGLATLGKASANLVKDVSRAVTTARLAGDEPRRAIWLLCNKRPVQTSKEAGLKRQILHAALSADPRYQTAPPSIELVAGDQIVREVVERPLRHSLRYLSSLVRNALSEEEFGCLADPEPGRRGSNETAYLARLMRYSEGFPDEARDDYLRAIVQDAWDYCVFRPGFARQLRGRLSELAEPVPDILEPLCLLALEPDIDVVSILRYVERLTLGLRLPPLAQRQANVLTGRVIRHVCYAEPSLLDGETMSKLLSALPLPRVAFWWDFALDLFLRCECEYLGLPDAGRQALHDFVTRNRTRAPPTT